MKKVNRNKVGKCKWCERPIYYSYDESKYVFTCKVHPCGGLREILISC